MNASSRLFSPSNEPTRLRFGVITRSTAFCSFPPKRKQIHWNGRRSLTSLLLVVRELFPLSSRRPSGRSRQAGCGSVIKVVMACLSVLACIYKYDVVARIDLRVEEAIFSPSKERHTQRTQPEPNKRAEINEYSIFTYDDLHSHIRYQPGRSSSSLSIHHHQ